jgi:hypothetical protein
MGKICINHKTCWHINNGDIIRGIGNRKSIGKRAMKREAGKQKAKMDIDEFVHLAATEGAAAVPFPYPCPTPSPLK